MKLSSAILRHLFVLALCSGLIGFTVSCKSEGEKLADKGIVALNAEDFDGLLKVKNEFDKLSPEEKEKAEAYLKKNEPQYEEKAKKLMQKKFGGLKL